MAADARPEAATEAVRAYWEAHVDDWKAATHPPGTGAFFEEVETYRFEKLHYLPRLVRYDGYPGKRVLDVGCGLGNDLSRFARGGAEVTGIDLAARAIELARANFEHRGLPGRFEIMDGEAMTFPDRSFDLVYCHTVLQFTPRPERMIEEIHRVLKPGGEAIVMAPNRFSWLYALQRVSKVEIDHLDSPVYRTYSKRELERMLAQFSDVRVTSERFPVRTQVHGGLKAKVFNVVFVGGFQMLPKPLVRQWGHHLIAFAKRDA